ncbi:ExbD/TolR family protein [Flavihumibacter petaseus]|nr:biopolymer transporter ExbD [Flavihumibacter petaseus]
MAEVLTRNAGSRRHAIKVDLTPMVDLGFLLISFFIFTTSLTKPREMRLNLPADGPPLAFAESTTLTVIPTANDVVCYFDGKPEDAIAAGRVQQTGYQLVNGLGDVIRKKQKALDATGEKSKLKVLISPDAGCSYKNIVAVMDEMVINGVKTYTLSEDKSIIELMQRAGFISR